MTHEVNKGGRPSIYTPEIADAICLRLMGGESLRRICQDDGLPDRNTVLVWLRDDKDGFQAKYARAREIQAEMLADEMAEISDDGRNDWMEKLTADGQAVGWTENGESARRSALRVSTRQWIATKLLPKKYGNREHVEHSGTIGIADRIRANREKRGSP